MAPGFVVTHNPIALYFFVEITLPDSMDVGLEITFT